MSTQTGSHPRGASLAPWLSVDDATRAVEFYVRAFAAEVVERLDGDDGAVMVAQLAIGRDSTVGSDGGARFWVQHDDQTSALDGKSPVRMILTVDDPDSLFALAVAAGAKVIAAIHEEHGWRIGRVADPFGHHWEIGERIDHQQATAQAR